MGFMVVSSLSGLSREYLYLSWQKNHKEVLRPIMKESLEDVRCYRRLLAWDTTSTGLTRGWKYALWLPQLSMFAIVALLLFEGVSRIWELPLGRVNPPVNFGIAPPFYASGIPPQDITKRVNVTKDFITSEPRA